jgi:hypothetical protein
MSVAICLASCGGKKEKTDIIARKPIVVRAKETRAMGDHRESRKVQWIGASYTVDTEFKADKSLPLISDGEQKYYDNRATVKILRKDGTVFFNRTFSKADFINQIDASYKDGALLGVVYDKCDSDNMYFAASVGSPDKSSDEYVPLVVKISRFGDVSIKKDATLDTQSEMGTNNTTIEEEEGV